MRWIADVVMKHRARALYRRISPHLPMVGIIADLGSGTGHNAELIRQRTALRVTEYDVADLHWVGPGPTLLANNSVPTHDHHFASLLLLYVLQYPESVAPLLSEAQRITEGPVIVVQSTYTGRLGRFVLRCREFCWGRAAFHIAAFLRIVECHDCPLVPCRYWTREELLDEFRRSGFVVRALIPSNWPGLSVSRDLFVLEAHRS
ncbi:hypothetical protein [Schlesneria paludicola]|uniref:hypothetical protein n=1 Tax=Schlesneria paludicola TaxID=360056 RepID=UPI00029AD022|nr:hypothetical protein [Schlesneria paludicola]